VSSVQPWAMVLESSHCHHSSTLLLPSVVIRVRSRVILIAFVALITSKVSVSIRKALRLGRGC
jgi:hypothetical protein